MIHIILLVVAMVFFLAAAAGFPTNRPWGLGWVGLFFTTLDALIKVTG